MSTQILIQNLLDPKFFPHPVRYCKVIETHISWVILTGDFAYKIKKPLNFQFLDFSSLEKRQFYCEAEIRLNKLLAPEIYLEVVKITGTAEKPQLNGDGNIIEYAVKMREFSQDRLFSELLAKHEITSALIDKLARLIAEFHQHTPVAASDSAFGTPEHVHAPVLQNFDQILPLLTDAADREQLKQLREWAEQQYKKHYELFKHRKVHGFIRDCHGDLHLGNIILYKEQPLLFDRIEFNDDFRWTDVMADVGFLAIDLDYHQQETYANRVISTYLTYSGDYHGLSILPYYIAYRAVVRAKVSLFRLSQPGLSAAEQQAIKQDYHDFIAIAQRLTQPTQPELFITHGLVGSGKSTVARVLVEQCAAIQLSSDIERKRLFGLPLDAKTNAALNQGIYDPQISQKTYTHLLEVARTIIKAGYSVVIDATFLKKAHRDEFHHLAQQLQVPFKILNCQAPRAQLEQWINKRQMENRDPSEADLKVLTMQEKNLEALTAEEQAYTININTMEINSAAYVKQLGLRRMSTSKEQMLKYAGE